MLIWTIHNLYYFKRGLEATDSVLVKEKLVKDKEVF